MNGIVYQVTGNGYEPKLFLSIWSLRRYYNGPVTVFYGGSDDRKMKRFCRKVPGIRVCSVSDPIANLSENLVEHHKHMLAKPATVLQSDYNKTIYLDADTTIHGRISTLFNFNLAFIPLWNPKTNRTMLLNDNVSKSSIRRRKLARLSERFPSIQPWIKKCSELNIPYVNSGVFVISRDHPMVREWALACLTCRDVGLDDELFLAVVMVNWLDQIAFLGTEWNTIHQFNKDFGKRIIWHQNSRRWERSESRWRLYRQMEADIGRL